MAQPAIESVEVELVFRSYFHMTDGEVVPCMEVPPAFVQSVKDIAALAVERFARLGGEISVGFQANGKGA